MKRTSPLDNVRVAAPCSAGWDNMIGDERVRFCGQCNLNVYNLSAMTKDAAERLVAQTEGKLCVRYYRRADGTILTGNCPVGLRALKRRLSRMASASAAAVLSFFGGVFALNGWRETRRPAVQGTVVIANERLPEETTVISTTNVITAEPPHYVMGEMVVDNISPAAHWKSGVDSDIRGRPARHGRKSKY